MAQDTRIVKCKFCGKLYHIHSMEVYPGDPSACHECNAKAQGGQQYKREGSWED